MNTVLKSVALVGLLMTAGCYSWPVGFVESSTPLEPGHYAVLGSEVTGSCSQIQWLWFSFGLGGSGQRHALASALSQVPGATDLTAMAIDAESFTIFPFFLPSFTTVRVTGTPVRVLYND